MLSKFYFYLRDKIQELELNLSQIIQKRLTADGNSRLFYISAIYLNFKLITFEILSDFVKFIVIIFADPAQGFRLFYNQRDLQACPYSYSSFRQTQKKIRTFSGVGLASMVAVAITTSLITNLIFGGKTPTWAATSNWVQQEWNTLSTDYARHKDPDNTTGWSKYSARDTNLTSSSSIQLLAQTSTTTLTTYADFAAGSSTNATTTGVGEAGNLVLPRQSLMISISMNTLAAKSDGTLWVWGTLDGFGRYGNNLPVQIGGISNVKSISAGGNQGFTPASIIKNDGTVWSVAYPGPGMTVTQVAGLSEITRGCNGNSHSLVLKSDGTVIGWGQNTDSQLGTGNFVNPPGQVQVLAGAAQPLSGISSITCGAFTSMALMASGTVWSNNLTGNNYFGQHPTLTGVAIAASTNSYHVLKADGTVWGWGYNGYGELGVGNKNSKVYTTPVQVTGLSGVVAIAAGEIHVLALKSDGTVWSWGNNSGGQLGVGDTAERLTPVQVPGLTGILSISAGYANSAAVDGNGNMWSWGSNGLGQLGDNTNTQRTSPVHVLSSVAPNVNFYVGLPFSPGVYESPIIDLAHWTINNSIALSFDKTYTGSGTNAIGLLIATSTSASTTWNYYGPSGATPTDCSGAGCYTGTSTIAGGNARYVRYKAYLRSPDQMNAPSLDEVRFANSRYHGRNLLMNLRFEDGTSTAALGQSLYDSSGNGYHATTSGVSNYYTVGKNGQGLNFPNSINRYEFLNRPLPSFTLSEWFKSTSTAASGGTMFAMLNSQAGTTTLYGASNMGLTSGTLIARVMVDTASPVSLIASSSNNTVNDGNWHHAIFSVDSNSKTASLYVDGQLATTTTFATDLFTRSIASYRIGTGAGNGYSTFYGTLDEIALFDRPLTSTEITNLYNLGYPGVQILTSSWYNSTDEKNMVARISWTEDASLAPGNQVKFQIRTASSTNLSYTDPATTTASSWQGPDGTSASFFSSTDSRCSKVGQAVTCAVSATTTVGDGIDDRWFQYRVILESAGDYTPLIEDINIQYVVNNPPEFEVGSFIAAQSTTTGLVEMLYMVRDTDSNSGSVDISLEYWNGSSWMSASTTYITHAMENGTSTLAISTSTYTTSSLVWDPKSDPALTNQYYAVNPGLQLRMVVNDREAANNLGHATTSLMLDTQNPNPGQILVKANLRPANVILSATDDSPFKMKISTDPALSDVADWVDYTSTTTLTISSTTANVYAIYRDEYDNYSTTSVELPITPTIVMIQDTSNVKVEPAEYRLFLSWKRPSPANFKSYNIYRTYDATNTLPTLIGSSSLYNINYFTDSNDLGMASGTDVFYYVSLETVDGNVSYLSDPMWGNADGTQNRGEGGGGLGNGSIPPTITNISTTTYANQAVIEWDTDIVSDSLVFYSTELPPDNDWTLGGATSTGVSTLLDNQGHFGRHRVTITDLIPGQIYYYKVQSVNVNDMAGYVFMDAQSQPLTFTTQTGATIVPGTVEVISLSNTTANIVWTTDQDSVINTITYATSTDSNGNLVNPITTDPGLNNVGRHLIKLSNLEPGKTYFFYVQSDNSVDKNTISAEDRYYQLTTTRDVTAPYISIGPADITPTDHSVIIQFTTDKPATSTVTVSAGIFSTSSESSSFNSSNHYMIEGLSPATSYNILITATDQNGNTGATSSSFITSSAPDTAGPTISTSTDWLAPSPTRAVITFYTNDEPGAGYVEYANGTSSFEANKLQVGSDQLSNEHIINLAGLIQNQTYYFRLRSSDASGNVSYSPASTSGEFYQFTTVPGPSISNISTSTTETSATISWHTSETADGYVIYGTPNLTSSLEKGNPAKVLDRTVTINGLTPGTTYQFKLKSTNESNGISVYPDGTTLSFTTDLGPLTISNATTSSITDQSAVITWNTTRAAQSIIYYGTTSRASGTLDQIATDNTFTTSPTVILTGLSSSTTYYFQIVNIDNLGRIATSTDEYLFTTKEPQRGQSEVDLLNQRLSDRDAEISSLQSQLAQARANQGGGGTITIVKTIDKTDKVAPVISGISASAVTATSAIIKWITDEEANSVMKYGSGNMDMSFGDYAMIKSHEVLLGNLLPNTSYQYRLYSADNSGNLTISSDLTFKTAEYTAEQALGLGTSSADSAITPELVQIAASKMIDLLTGLSSNVSLGSFETTVISQFDALNKLASIIPGPVLSGEPATEITPTTVTIKWKTDKAANSMIAYAPEILFAQSKGSRGYLQLVGEPNQLVTDHTVKIVGLKPDTTYHYQLRSKAKVGSEVSSRDFSFKTKPEALEIISVNTETLAKDKAKFNWLTSQETDTELAYTPYRNGKLSPDEVRVVREKTLTTNHEVTISDLEAGVVYEFEIRATDKKGIKINKVISFFSTTKDDLPPEITDIQTESALSQSKDAKVQTIMTWTTSEPTVSQIRYGKGVFENEEDLKEETPIETVYSRKHTLVITKFDIGEVYSFRVVATDSGGNTTVSKPHIVLTPKQKEGVFELILNTFESTFGWLGKMK